MFCFGQPTEKKERKINKRSHNGRLWWQICAVSISEISHRETVRRPVDSTYIRLWAWCQKGENDMPPKNPEVEGGRGEEKW